MPNRLPRVMTREQVRAILAVPNTKTPHGLRQRVVLETLYHAGLRASEIADLKAVDVHIAELRIDVRDSKGGQSRAVPIGETLAGWLRSWTLVRPEKSPWFFCALYGRGYGEDAKAGNPLHGTWLRRVVKAAARKAAAQHPELGIEPKHISPHVFRHTYATELLEDGFNLAEVQELLGHADISTTRVYLHIRPEVLAAKVQARDEKRASLADDVEEKLQDLDTQQLTALKGILAGL